MTAEASATFCADTGAVSPALVRGTLFSADSEPLHSWLQDTVAESLAGRAQVGGSAPWKSQHRILRAFTCVHTSHRVKASNSVHQGLDLSSVSHSMVEALLSGTARSVQFRLPNSMHSTPAGESVCLPIGVPACVSSPRSMHSSPLSHPGVTTSWRHLRARDQPVPLQVHKARAHNARLAALQDKVCLQFATPLNVDV